ncbi:MAG: Rieske 2Fe-2S domain-containing protein [Pirellulales bacterium]|nr:Rieske 2Fe-2S domain-containing protein [Pirellulales bacterium]
MANPVEIWKSKKHGFDVWPDIERYAAAGTSMKAIDSADLERMKWYGFFYRKRDEPGRYMNRIRITAGELSGAQAKEIARLAYEYGHGIVDVTTRANLQVQGLSIEHLPRVHERLTTVGLSSKQTGHDNIRNVFAHPFSGLMADELIDTRELCHEITNLFLDSREYADLPRKMNICLNGTPHHSAHFWTQDISYLATRAADGRVKFLVLIGGTQGQNPHLAWQLPALVEPRQVIDVTRAILDLFRERGSREKRNVARFRFLVEAMTPVGILDWLHEHLPFSLEPTDEVPVPASAHDELIGWFRQAELDLWTMGLSVPLGRLTWQQLEGLGVLADRWGNGQLRVTHEQGIAVVNLPQRARHAALTEAAALGLSIHADALDRNTMACTGSQFCNIAVTETKGQMFQLLEKLRKRSVCLEGIRIHMSGCPSSCAQHFTADIGLKGVRVRRLFGTREGFDVFLGGGVAQGIQMGRTYRLGVDADQLPTLIEEVVAQYYLHHQPGESFSDYWRKELPADREEKTGDAEFRPPVWQCEKCHYLHEAVDPPIFCPSCAGLRRYFVRLEAQDPAGTKPAPAAEPQAKPQRSDGFLFAAAVASIPPESGLEVEVGGRPLALFRAGDKVHAVDALCPHEGAPLAQGEFRDGVVTCPWHGWTFDACSGCSLAPKHHDLARYETLVDAGNVFVKLAPATPSDQTIEPRVASPRYGEAMLRLLEVREESHDVRTFCFDNRAGQIPFDLPGKFVRIAVPIEGRETWRSFTISSSPALPKKLELTIKLNPHGLVSRHLFAHAQAGAEYKLQGAQGGFFFDPEQHQEPLVLVSAGSGITPMMSIARFIRDRRLKVPCTLIHGARTAEDLLFHRECRHLSSTLPGFKYYVTLSRPEADWQGNCGRVDIELLLACAHDAAASRFFLCGPDDFMERLTAGLLAAGMLPERIHTEQFHAATLARL